VGEGSGEEDTREADEGRGKSVAEQRERETTKGEGWTGRVLCQFSTPSFPPRRTTPAFLMCQHLQLFNAKDPSTPSSRKRARTPALALPLRTSFNFQAAS